MSRSRKHKNSSGNYLPWIILGVFFVLAGIIYVGNSLGGSDACGNRGEDEEKKGYCLTNSSDYKHIVIVTGNTQNSSSSDLDFTSGELKDLIAGAFYSTEAGEIPDIKILSAARGSDSISYKLTKPAKNISASRNNLKNLGLSINSAVNSKPTRNGADYMSAILSAGIHLNGASDTSKKLILVIGSGYSDSGMLDFAHDDILNKEAYIDTIIRNDERLREGELRGIDIRWYNMGSTTSPQAPMSDYANRTISIYEKVLSYAGAANLRLDLGKKDLDRESAAKDTPYTVDRVYAEKLKSGDGMMVDSTIARFVNNEDKLTNPNNVKDYVRAFISKLQPSQQIVITGYMDRCLPGNDLGLRRASAIRDLLVEMGVPYERIEVRGEYGPPPADYSSAYVCHDDPNVSDDEQRTVRIAVK